jgi:hypothetical protein
MSDSIEVRKARTEAAFREVNERIAENAARFDAGETDFICECDDPECTERVEVTLEEYERVRADGAQFLLAPGHGDTGIEHVVARNGTFIIVEKVQEAARAIARRLNPRTT